MSKQFSKIHLQSSKIEKASPWFHVNKKIHITISVDRCDKIFTAVAPLQDATDALQMKTVSKRSRTGGVGI
jgi:hypothetical protein